MTTEAQNSPFIKNLASSDKRTRDSALQSLRTYLSVQTSISELDLLKLWKGLFYCLWMQDKPKLQNRLSLDLASLPSTLKAPVVLPFLRTFWLTIAREWSSIEALRLDKYLFLIRHYVNASLRYLSKDDWGNTKVIKEYMDILRATPLNPSDMKIPNGLRYHVLDVYVDELEKVGGEEWESTREVLDALMGPVEELAREGKLKVVRDAAKECLGDERLKAWRGETVEDEEMNDEEDEEWGGIDD